MQELIAKFPEIYRKSWSPIIQIADTIINYPVLPPDNNLWPILALGKKASSTTKGIAALASLELWGDAFILSRPLFEVEVIVKWLLKQDVKDRIQKYLLGIEQEKRRMLQKMAAGISISAQVLSDLIKPENLKVEDPASEINKTWSGLTVREMAREVNMEQNYDLPYWISSAFIHSHALSILDANPKRNKENPILTDMFSQGEKRFLNTIVMEGVPCQVLHTFSSIDSALNLGIKGQIDSAWYHVHMSFNDGKVRFISPSEGKGIKEDELAIIGIDGTKKVYSPRPFYNRKKRHKKRKR